MAVKHDRVIAALELREPDRVPVMDLFQERIVINEVLGGKPSLYSRLFAAPAAARWLDLILPRLRSLDLSDGEVRRFAYDATDAMVRLGYDAALVTYLPVFRFTGSRRVEDIHGRLLEMNFDRQGNVTGPIYREGTIKGPSDWEALDKRPLLRLPDKVNRAFVPIQRDFGERIFVFGVPSFGLFENTWQPLGFERFVVAARKEKDFLRRMISFYTDLHCVLIEAMADAGVPGVLYGDDLAYRSGPMLNPRMLEELYGEAYRRIAETAHVLGMKIIHHSCGNTAILLPWIAECGFDGVHPLEPTAGMDLAASKKAVGDRICLVGNIDVTRILVDADREEVEAAVKEAIAAAGRGGGFILAPAHSHGDVSVDRLRWMVEAAHRYGAYPLTA